ncbi:MAG: TrbI/VirB10 family protein [Bacteroidetes bacterium]|nr:TrbI/VirB10 family protein [Bacteroidota bacterium]MCY4205479.1 TrbI/VirB10 family protein [Bacteroidota bacterium]
MTNKLSELEHENEASEFVDPAPVARLSRRNILALALSLAGVLLVLFFSSRRQATTPVTEYELPSSSTPDVLTLVPMEPSIPQPNPWEPSKVTRSERTDERKTNYDQARQSRGMIHVSNSVTPDSSQGSAVAPEDKKELILLEGSVIEAALETGIHTGRPGPVRARVIRPVRDSKWLDKILIPAGTQLIGSMQGTLAGEEPRALIVWSRMIFPNGETKDLPELPALDLSGEGGLQDKVKYYRAQRFGSAAMLALVGSATSLATTGTAGSLLGGSLALELSRTASGQLERGKRRQPTLILRPGYQFLVYVSRDMVFTEPYTE